MADAGPFSVYLKSCAQVWQEINEENKHVRDIMTTLESFQLDNAPSKPSGFSQESDIMPVQVEHRYAGCVCERETQTDTECETNTE